MKPYKIKARLEGHEWFAEYMYTTVEFGEVPADYRSTPTDKHFTTEAEANNETKKFLADQGVLETDMEVVDTSGMTEEKNKKMVGGNDFFPTV